MKKAIIMCRVSTDEQAKGYSLDVQHEQLVKYCQRNNIEIIKEYKEDHSAKNFDRPEFKKLLQFAKSNKNSIDYLLVTSWDRFSRNITDSFNMLRCFKALSIEVQAIEQPIDFNVPESKALLAMNLVFPEIDNDRRSLKIRGGIRGSLKAGRWCRKAPVGYKNSRDDQNKPLLIPSDKAKYIQYAFNEILRGKNQAEIRFAINKMGHKISRNNLSNILRNPVYMGKIVVSASEDEPEVWVEGVHQGIINDKTFYKVQEILEQRKRSSKRASYTTQREELPLRGKLYCSKCKSKMTGSASRSQNGSRFFYYHCNSCKKERFNALKLNGIFTSILTDFKFTKQSKQLYKKVLESLLLEDNGNVQKQRELLKEKQDKLIKRMENLQDLFVDGKITQQAYNSAYTRYTNESESNKQELDNLSQSNTTFKQNIEKAYRMLESFDKLYNQSDIYGKQRLIGSIFPENIEFDGKKCRTTRINDVLRYILEIVKELDKNKKGQISKNLSLSHLVVPLGLEPRTT